MHWFRSIERFQFPAIIAQRRWNSVREHLSLAFLCHIQFSSCLDDR